MRPGPTRVETYCLLERLVEGAALPPVEIQHRHVLRHAAERLADHGRRDARSLRLRRHRRHEGIEITAAAGGVRGGGEEEGVEEDDRTELAHANPLFEGIMP
jgi:hypothetical protein